MLRPRIMSVVALFILLGVTVVGGTAAATLRVRARDPRRPRADARDEAPPPSFAGEPKLRVSDSQAQAFMGALVALGRADGVLTGAELDVLRAVADHHGFVLDEVELMSEEHDASRALDLVRGVASTPFRQSATSPPAEVARGFLFAARRLASADGTSDARVDDLLTHFEQLLGEGHDAGGSSP